MPPATSRTVVFVMGIQNSAIALKSLWTFSMSGPTKTSKSPVNRGSAYRASAWAPTIKYSTRWAFKYLAQVLEVLVH